MAKILKTSLYDDKSTCRVAAIKACTEIAEVINDPEWAVEVFEEFVMLMTDEKTSVSKEALKYIQVIMKWLETKLKLRGCDINSIIKCEDLKTKV